MKHRAGSYGAPCYVIWRLIVSKNVKLSPINRWRHQFGIQLDRVGIHLLCRRGDHFLALRLLDTPTHDLRVRDEAPRPSTVAETS